MPSLRSPWEKSYPSDISYQLSKCQLRVLFHAHSRHSIHFMSTYYMLHHVRVEIQRWTDQVPVLPELAFSSTPDTIAQTPDIGEGKINTQTPQKARAAVQLFLCNKKKARMYLNSHCTLFLTNMEKNAQRGLTRGPECPLDLEGGARGKRCHYQSWPL